MSDYVDLVCIRLLSRDIRRLLYYELLKCSGIHLNESALMTELCRDEAHLNNYYSSLIKQTTSRDPFHALSHSNILLFFLSALFLYPFLSSSSVFSIYFLPFPPTFASFLYPAPI